MIILTEKEYNEAKNKVRQIEEYIRKEIMLNIEGIHKIPFGTEKTRLGNSHLDLCVDKNTLVIHSGYLSVYFDEGEVPTEIGSGVYIYNSWNYGGNACYELISEWKRIKDILNSILDKSIADKKEIKNVLDSFEV